VRIEPGRVAVVTGGASGIGFALPAAVVTTLAADMSEPGDIERLAQTAFALGPVQLVCLLRAFLPRLPEAGDQTPARSPRPRRMTSRSRRWSGSSRLCSPTPGGSSRLSSGSRTS
jgi:hypothetical protein